MSSALGVAVTTAARAETGRRVEKRMCILSGGPGCRGDGLLFY